MFKLEGGLAMKELAQHMGCDASFITSVADTLERRGFASREPSQRDRRVKNLVLTEEGIAAKERLMAGARGEDAVELRARRRRAALLPRLLRKMLDDARPASAT